MQAQTLLIIRRATTATMTPNINHNNHILLHADSDQYNIVLITQSPTGSTPFAQVPGSASRISCLGAFLCRRLGAGARPSFNSAGRRTSHMQGLTAALQGQAPAYLTALGCYSALLVFFTMALAKYHSFKTLDPLGRDWDGPYFGDDSTPQSSAYLCEPAHQCGTFLGLGFANMETLADERRVSTTVHIGA